MRSAHLLPLVTFDSDRVIEKSYLKTAKKELMMNRTTSRQFLAIVSTICISSSAFGQVVETQKVKPNGRVVTRDYIYNGINPTPWYSAPTVRQQLNLTDDQFNQLNSAYKTNWTTYNQGVTQIGDQANNAARLNELNNNFHRDWNKATTTVFTQPADQQRFNQLSWQYQQYGAFNNPAVRQQLNLNDEQVQKFRTYDQQWNQQMAKWNTDYANNRQSVINAYNQNQKEFQTNVNTVLTPTQQEQWQTMIGKPYSFGPDVYFQNVPVTTAKPVLK
jgi:hypothetical protein